MFTVKFLGGAKKSFLIEKLDIDKSDISVSELLDLLLNLKPENDFLLSQCSGHELYQQ